MSGGKKKHNAILWARMTSELLGWPMLIILFSNGLQKTVFTLTCTTASFRCEYSFVSGTSPEPSETEDASELKTVVNQMAKDWGYLQAYKPPKK